MRRFFGAVVAMSVATAARAGDPPRFVYVDLGGLSSFFTIAQSINEHGVTTGAAFAPFFPGYYTAHAFTRAMDGKLIDIATQPEINTVFGSWGYDINDQGVVVGLATFAHAFNPDNMFGVLAPPVMWVDGEVISLGLEPGALGGEAHAVNNNNQIVGHFGLPSGQPLLQSFLWDNREIRILDELQDRLSRAWDINDLGHIVGQAGFPGEGFNPYLVRQHEATILDFGGAAYGINDHDQVVGVTGLFGFVWEDGAHITLPTVAPQMCLWPRSINNYGDIVGKCTGSFGVLWREGEVYVLNEITPNLPKDTFLGEPFKINDRGQIVGIFFRLGSSIEHAYRLDPVTPDVSGDGVVDGLDLARLIIAWGSDDPYIDLDGDGVVNTADLTDLLLHWGPVPERKPYFWTK